MEHTGGESIHNQQPSIVVIDHNAAQSHAEQSTAKKNMFSVRMEEDGDESPHQESPSMEQCRREMEP